MICVFFLVVYEFMLLFGICKLLGWYIEIGNILFSFYNKMYNRRF